MDIAELWNMDMEFDKYKITQAVTEVKNEPKK